MPRILNPKHEEMAISLSKGETQTAAYMAAFGITAKSSAESSAARLMKHARYGNLIRARRDELRQLESAKERQVLDLVGDQPVSKTWIMRQLGHVVTLARQANNLPAMNKALELLGKEHGMFKETKGKTKVSLDDLSLDDLQKLLSELESDPEVIAGMAEDSALNRSSDDA